MSFKAKVLEVMIASPGGLEKERDVAEAVIADWNAVHSKKEELVLLARRWERDSRIELGGRAQQMIDDDILAGSDIVIGMFHTRIGTPTGDHESGTVEEIKLHHKAGKPVILFFSTAPVDPNKIDPVQFQKVNEFKEWAQTQGLTGSFSDATELMRTLSMTVAQTLNRNAYIKRETSADFVQIAALDAVPAPVSTPVLVTASTPQGAGVSGPAAAALLRAANGKSGMMLLRSFVGGEDLSIDGKNMMEDQTPRTIARWKSAVEELRSLGFIRDTNGRGQVFEVTDRGFQAADNIGQ